MGRSGRFRRPALLAHHRVTSTDQFHHCLIRCERLERLALRCNERGTRRSDDSHQRALDRLQTLLLYSSGGCAIPVPVSGSCAPCAASLRP